MLGLKNKSKSKTREVSKSNSKKLKDFLKKMKKDIVLRVSGGRSNSLLKKIKGKLEVRRISQMRPTLKKTSNRKRDVRSRMQRDILTRVDKILSRSINKQKNTRNIKIDEKPIANIFKPSTGGSTRNESRVGSRWEHLGYNRRLNAEKKYLRVKENGETKEKKGDSSKLGKKVINDYCQKYFSLKSEENLNLKGSVKTKLKQDRSDEKEILDNIFHNKVIQSSLTHSDRGENGEEKKFKTNIDIINKLKKGFRRKFDVKKEINENEKKSEIKKLKKKPEKNLKKKHQTSILTETKNSQKSKLDNPLLNEVMLLSGRNSTKFLRDQTENILKAIEKYDKKAEEIISSRSTSVRHSERKKPRRVFTSIFDSTNKNFLQVNSRRNGQSKLFKGLKEKKTKISKIPKLNFTNKFQAADNTNNRDSESINLNEIKINMEGLSTSDKQREFKICKLHSDDTDKLNDEELRKLFEVSDIYKKKNSLSKDFSSGDSSVKNQVNFLTLQGIRSTKDSDDKNINIDYASLEKVRFEEMLRLRMKKKQIEREEDISSCTEEESCEVLRGNRKSSELVKKIKDQLVEGLKQFNFKE